MFLFLVILNNIFFKLFFHTVETSVKQRCRRFLSKIPDFNIKLLMRLKSVIFDKYILLNI